MIKEYSIRKKRKGKREEGERYKKIKEYSIRKKTKGKREEGERYKKD